MLHLVDLAEIAVGTTLLTVAYAVVLPPLFGAAMPSTTVLGTAVATAVLGCLFLGRGIHRAIVRSDVQRPDIDTEHDHTLDWITRP